MDKTNSLVKINIGCGSTPIEGWFNYDNSFSIRLSKQPILYNILGGMGFISKNQREYINFLKHCIILRIYSGHYQLLLRHMTDH